MINRQTYFLPEEKFQEIKQKYPKFNEPWTEDEVANLIDISLRHKKTREIAQELGRSPKSVRLKMMELGLYKKRTREWTKKDDEQLLSYYQEGRSFIDMCNKFDTTIESVVRRLVFLRLDIFFDMEIPYTAPEE